MQKTVGIGLNDVGEVVDHRVRALLADYARLTGAGLTDVEPHLIQLDLPPSESASFEGRARFLLALDTDVLLRHPDAELPVIGGAFWNGLLAAVRARGQRLVGDDLPVTVTPSADVPDVLIVGATLALTERVTEMHRVVRVTAKVTMAAGAEVQEQVIESEDIYLTPSLSVDRIVPELIADIESKVSARTHAMHLQAERDVAAELTRIDRYYGALIEEISGESDADSRSTSKSGTGDLSEVGARARSRAGLRSRLESEAGSTSAQIRTIQKEHERRRAEEIRRHGVRVDVEPLQVIERGVTAERVSWRLTTPNGRTADLHGQRYLSGDGGWGIPCPVCRTAAAQITVCREGHAAGVECVRSCSVCAEAFCLEHGHWMCAVDGAPMCREHAAKCSSCERMHCTQHQGRCEDGDHDACNNCLTACAICGRITCREHALETDPSAPRGLRTLCRTCVVYCEGSPSELVGKDETAACGTCGNAICERHQVTCVVDGKPHCSKHLKRADRSRRFVCGSHISACDLESREVVFAADELQPCVDCGKKSCTQHGRPCHGDGRWYCSTHLSALVDVANAAACEAHRTACHVDGRAYSLAGTSACEVCGRATCHGHLRQCGWCGGRVCTKELTGARCVTCEKLVGEMDPPDEVVAAASAVTSGQRPKKWLIGRDGGRFVVQLDLGWTRRVVITVPHGESRASRVVRHSVLGTKGL